MAETPTVGRTRLHPASDDERVRIGQALKAQRAASGLTLASVAAAVGLSRGYVQNVEAGRRRPTPELLERLAAVYGVKVAAITEDAA